MATAPKAVAKTTAKTAAPAEAAAVTPPLKSKKKMIIIGAAILVMASSAGAWYFFSQKSSSHAASPPKHESAKAPVFVTLEQFTVNLQPENAEQFLQIAFTVQVSDQAQVDLIKLYMPLVRSRLLLLLSSKKPSEISTPDGKKKLADDIIAQLKLPFTPQAQPQEIDDVFFTSFVIQ
jgi:flagellar protein FliL